MPTAGGGRHRLRPQRPAANPCAKVMRGHVLPSYATAMAIHHMPDNILVDAITPNRSILGYGAAHSPGANRGRRGPSV